MKTYLFIIVLVCSFSFVKAQIFTPEIKVQDTGGNVDVNFSDPTGKFQINGTMAPPSTSELNGNLIIGSNSTGLVNTFGIHTNPGVSVYSWIQSRHKTDNTLFFDLALNPLGGNVGIGIINPSTKLHVTGSITYSGGTLTSDERLKRDIQDFPTGLALVEQMKVKKYKYKKPKKKEPEHKGLPSEENENSENIVEESSFYDQEQIGVLAQDIQKIAPNLVGSFLDDDGEETLTINFTAFTFILVNAVKEQQQEIETLESRITALEKLLDKQAK